MLEFALCDPAYKYTTHKHVHIPVTSRDILTACAMHYAQYYTAISLVHGHGSMFQSLNKLHACNMLVHI